MYVGAEEGDMCGIVATWGAKLLMFEPNEKVYQTSKLYGRLTSLQRLEYIMVLHLMLRQIQQHSYQPMIYKVK